jgi:hypothetical protein
LQIDIAVSLIFLVSDTSKLSAAKFAEEHHEHIAASTANCGTSRLQCFFDLWPARAHYIGVTDASPLFRELYGPLSDPPWWTATRFSKDTLNVSTCNWSYLRILTKRPHDQLTRRKKVER